MKYLCFFVISVTLALLPEKSLGQQQDQNLYRIYFEQYDQIRHIESIGVNVYNHQPDQYIEIIATADQALQLKSEGFQVSYLAKNFKELMAYSRLKTSPEYHDYQELMDELEQIAEDYPEITQVTKIGESVLGRTIACLKISDNAEENEDEIPILICGAHHGNEVLSVEATLFQINHLLENYKTDNEITDWIDNYEIWFVPLVNPDGREAVRRTNENGIDLNRNYSFEHTATGNHGTPFSEPETRAIRDLTAEFPPALSLTYHTSGRYVLYSWTHAYEGAPDSAAFIHQGQILAESIVFPEGTETGHYTLRQGGRWYFTEGEYCDYMYATHGTMAYTIEMWTRQNPDGSVIPEVVERNLIGFKTFMRQAQQSGVSGLITDKETGEPIVAKISVPTIDDQDKLSPRLSDAKFGRYHKYLAPGDYQLLIQAEGYRDYYIDVTITPDELTLMDIQMESGPLLLINNMLLIDNGESGTSGNDDGLLNLAENMGIQFELKNENAIPTDDVWIRIKSSSEYVTILQDSVFFGTIEAIDSLWSNDLFLFNVSADCPDRTELSFKVEISDTEGIGWVDTFFVEVYAPSIRLDGVAVMDEELNNNQVLERGERSEVVIRITNHGRQTIQTVPFELTVDDDAYTIYGDIETWRSIPAGQTTVLYADIELSAEADPVLIGEFLLSMSSNEGYTKTLDFRLQSFEGLYDDFEASETDWTTASNQTTSNHHNDWQLGEPQGLSGDPDHTPSGLRCWGTDLGYELYNGESWNGAYQNNVSNYLKSPVIDCSAMSGTGLQYRRWLTSTALDVGSIYVNDSLIWESARRGHTDGQWNTHQLDISKIADGNAEVQIVFEMNTNQTGIAGGWNIDDFIVANGMFNSNSAHPVDSNLHLLVDAYPNPFSAEGCNITLDVDKDQLVIIQLNDMNGRTIRELVNRRLSAGNHEFKWDGRTDQGQSVKNGIYFLDVMTTSETRQIRLVKID